jgi:hypothetical protein
MSLISAGSISLDSTFKEKQLLPLFLHWCQMFKGLSHEMDLAVMTRMDSSRPKKGTRLVFKIFSCSNDFFKQKVYISR